MFVNTGHAAPWSIVIACVGLCVPAVVNLAGVRSMAGMQAVTTVRKFVPPLLMVTVGLSFVRSANFGAFNAAGSAISAAAVALISYLGIETASVAAGRVRNPTRSVARATVLSTLGCAVVFLLGTVTVLGTVPNAALRLSTAPFTDSADGIVGGSWAGLAVAVAAVVSGFGALVGWMLVRAEIPMAAVRDQIFPAPFGRIRRSVPVFGIVSSTVLASLLVVLSYTSFDKVFTTLVLLLVFTAVVPYLFSAGAQAYWLLTRGRATAWSHLVRDVGVSGLALVFSFWVARGQRLPGRVLRHHRAPARCAALHLAQGRPQRVRGERARPAPGPEPRDVGPVR